LQQCN